MDKRTTVVLSQVMAPAQANEVGLVFGGEIMKLMDTTAGAVAQRYAQSSVVTARVDEIQFFLPIRTGSLLTLTATIAYVGRTSMEIVVFVDVEDLKSKSESIRALSAFFTLVAIDEHGTPREIPPLEIETEEERILYNAVKQRRQQFKRKTKATCL